MKLLHMLNNVDDAWVKLVKEAEDGVVKVAEAGRLAGRAQKEREA